MSDFTPLIATLDAAAADVAAARKVAEGLQIRSGGMAGLLTPDSLHALSVGLCLFAEWERGGIRHIENHLEHLRLEQSDTLAKAHKGIDGALRFLSAHPRFPEKS